MPYEIKENSEGEHCVYKKGESEPLKCHDSRAKAIKHLKALYANVEMSKGNESMSDEEYTIEEEDDGSFCVYKGDKKVKSGFSDREEAETWIEDQEGEGEEEDDGEEDDYEDDEESEMSTRGFAFTELSRANVKKFDGMAAGSFVDMRGKEVEFTPKELAEYYRNTLAILESTRSEKGELVGLPIDENNHDHNGGAGWIVGLELDKQRNIIRFLANWTERGVELISKNMRRYFSPTVDITNRVILGGSLTNWPATRTARGHMLLRPVELSQGVYRRVNPATKSNNVKLPSNLSVETLRELGRKVLSSLGMRSGKPTASDEQNEEINLSTKGVDTMPNEIDEYVGGEQKNPAIRELLKTPEAVAELGRIAEEKAKVFIDAERHQRDVVEFASTLVGGTKEKPFGLPVPAEEVVAVLLSLPPKQEKAVRALLVKTLNAAINFSERGYAGRDNDYMDEESELFNPRPRLEEPYRRYLSQWVSAGKSVDSFFTANPELGNKKEWNIAEFTRMEK